MTVRSLIVSQQGVRTLEQMARELRIACSGISQREWAAIFLASAKTAGIDTVQPKIKSIKRLPQYCLQLVQCGRQTVERYRLAGWRKASADDWIRVQEFASSLPEKGKSAIEAFRCLPRDKQVEQACLLFLTLAIFFAVAGGPDLEGGIPDLDLKIDIGIHRNVYFHSLLAGLPLEFSMRLAAELLGRFYLSLPEEHHDAWDRIHAFVMSNRHIAIGAMWVGIGMHLLKDSNWFADSTKPLVGLPGSHTMAVHQTILAANGIACEAIAASALAERESVNTKS